jgi:hypothetical protein
MAFKAIEPKIYSSLKVELYGNRWQVKVNLAHLNTTLGMDVLQCLTPSVVCADRAQELGST